MALRLNQILSIQKYSTSFVRWQWLSHSTIPAKQIHQQPLVQQNLTYSNEILPINSWNESLAKQLHLNLSILKNKTLATDPQKEESTGNYNRRKSLDEGKQSDNAGTSSPSPNLDKETKRERLLEMKYFIEQFMPKYFDHNSLVKYITPTMFSRNVIFENDTRGSNKTTVGYVKFNMRLNAYKLYYRLSFMLKKVIVLRVDIDEDTNSLDTTFRIVRHRTGRLPGTVSSPEVSSNQEWDDYFREFTMKHAEWVDYRMIVNLTNRGTIWKIVLTKLTRRQSSAKVKPRLIDRFLSSLGRLKRSPVAACESHKTTRPFS